MTNHKEDEGWSNVGFLSIFVFVNSKDITIQGIYNSMKFQK